MKKVVILSNKKNAGDRLLFRDEKFYRCYEYLSDLARQNGLLVYSASHLWYDSQKKFFKVAWRFDGKKWRKDKNIRPKLVYDKSGFNEKSLATKTAIMEDFKTINDPEFTLLAGHKLFASLLFPHYFKKYYPVRDREALIEAVKKIRGRKIVLKPPLGCGGNGIVIISKKDALRTPLNFPLLAQEFIDCSRGIENIAKGIHDLRLVFVNKKLIYAFVREPAKNCYLANLAQGGTMYYIPNNRKPKSLTPIIKEVQEIFKFFNPKIYSIDFIFDKNKRPWIVEFNTMPGFFFFSEEHKKKQKIFFLEIIRVLKNEIS